MDATDFVLTRERDSVLSKASKVSQKGRAALSAISFEFCRKVLYLTQRKELIQPLQHEWDILDR